LPLEGNAMRILIADDEAVSRFALEDTLGEWGYDVIAVADGSAAWDLLQRPDAPELAILDWEMPGFSGPELCRKVRDAASVRSPYLMLLTHRKGTTNIVAGLKSGANDYLSKPFQEEELAARLDIAAKMMELQQRLAVRVEELERERAQVKTLRGLLPICGWCKKIRTDEGDYWQRLEEYLGAHTEVSFTHSMCPACFEREMQSGQKIMKDRKEG
jgi:sigma-B regulation protein RsbU (phosphoserine phosphatase)